MSLPRVWQSWSTARRTGIFIVSSAVLFVVLIMIVTSSSRRQAYLRNLHRQRDVAFIAKVINEYKKATNHLPEGIDTSPKQICRHQDPAVCAGAIILPLETMRSFATSTEWLGDPSASHTQQLGYLIAASSSASNAFVLQAPHAELGVRIGYPR